MNVFVRGDRELRELLMQLPRALRRKLLRRALETASRPMVEAAAAAAPAQTGLLRAAIRLRRLRPRRGEWIAMSVGPANVSGPAMVARTGRLRRLSEASAAKAEAEGKTVHRKRNPRRYAHLVEHGHALVRGTGASSRVVGYAPAKPFMRPAYQMFGGQVLRDAQRYVRTHIDWMVKMHLRRRR